MESTTKTPVNAELIQSINDLCKVGLYLDALELAESKWGSIETWKADEQQVIAIKLYANLGGDRRSDAILLKAWRKNRSNAEFLYRVFYYTLNSSGPIIAHEMFKKYQDVFQPGEKLETDILGFESIIHKRYRNYTRAEQLIDKAILINPSDSWLTSLKIQLLDDQGETEQAKIQAQKHFEAYPSPYNMRVLSNLLRKTDGAAAAITLYEQHINDYQSASAWYELAWLYSSVHNWSACQSAIEKFEQVRIVQDKKDNKSLVIWKAQIAIDQQALDVAIELLESDKSGYWKIVRENLMKSQGTLKRKVLDVPFLRQQHMTCAPTTLAALCQYWGDQHKSDDIADQICFDGTPETKERQWLRDNNYAFKEFELEESLAYQLIDHDIPFALVTVDGFSAHIQAVIGYNQQVGTIYIMDPSSSVMQEMLTKETIEHEAYNGARCIAFVPQAKAELLDQFEFPASELYVLLDKFACAQMKNDFAAAQTILNELVALAPEHRITMRAQRNFAVSNNDTGRIFEANSNLLARYPEQSALITSQYYCQRDLGRREQSLEFLYSNINKRYDLDVISTLFGEIYDTSAYDEIKFKALALLKRYGGYSANAHWSLANYYWSQQSFELATEHYLYAFCLDETDSQYIQSYFKAALHLKQEQDALKIIQRRYEKYGVRSHLPAISLYQAYDLIDQEHIGIDCLFEALKLHPSNADLLKYLAERLIIAGDVVRFDEILPKVKATIEQEQYQELIASQAEKNGDFSHAISFYQKAYEKSPFITRYANGYFRLLHKQGAKAQIDQELVKLYETHASNSLVLDYIADWHSDDQFREKVLTKFVQLRPDYSAIRKQLIDVRLKLGHVEQALLLAKETVERLVGEINLKSYLAKCYLKAGDFDRALEIAKEVLKTRIDNDLAFSVMMEASQSRQDKVVALDFVYEQIQTQNIFGDSAWNYWFEANALLPQSRLKDFIDYLVSSYPQLWYSYSIAANYYKQFDDLPKALEMLELGISKFPLTPRFYNDRGQIFEILGDIDQAIKAYQKALSLNPTWTDVTKRLCELLEKHRSTADAQGVIQTGLKHSPDDGVLYGYLADIQMQQADDQAAISSLVNAVKYCNDYRWAWNQLIHLCKRTEQADLPYNLALELSKQQPYQGPVWRNLAYLVDDEAEKLSLLDKAIKCDNYFIKAYQDKSEYFEQTGDYKSALAVLDQTPWGEQLPEALLIQKVDLLIEIGQNEQAIDLLKSILFNTLGYAHLWSKLFDLLEKSDRNKDIVECSHKSVEQNRHDPDVLCYAGENLIAKGTADDRNLATEYLHKAYRLAPNDQYIALTYIDMLIENKAFEQALDELNKFEQYRQSNVALARKIAVLCELEQYQQAFARFESLILDSSCEYWPIDHSFKALSQEYPFEKLMALFNKRFDQLPKIQAYYYVYSTLENLGANKHKQFLSLFNDCDNGQHWLGGFLALIDFWDEHKISPLPELVDRFFDRISVEPELIKQLGNLYINLGHYHSVIRLYEGCKVDAQLSAFNFYHYRIALQITGRWDDAGLIIERGLACKPDSSIHNLKLWQFYELYRTGGLVTLDDLAVIDYNELISVEQYVHTTLVVGATLSDNSVESKRDELSDLLRNCQRHYQQVAGHEFANHARNTLKQRLKAQIATTGFWQKLLINWWINNRF